MKIPAHLLAALAIVLGVVALAVSLGSGEPHEPGLTCWVESTGEVIGADAEHLELHPADAVTTSCPTGGTASWARGLR